MKLCPEREWSSGYIFRMDPDAPVVADHDGITERSVLRDTAMVSSTSSYHSTHSVYPGS